MSSIKLLRKDITQTTALSSRLSQKRIGTEKRKKVRLKENDREIEEERKIEIEVERER